MLYTIKVRTNSDSLIGLQKFGTIEKLVTVEHDYFESDEIEVITVETPKNIDRFLDTSRDVIEYDSEHQDEDNVHGIDKEMPNGDFVHIWFNRHEEQWYGCWSGTYRGIGSESEDIELYANNQESAILEIVDLYQEFMTLKLNSVADKLK